jgi:hypothetical protein
MVSIELNKRLRLFYKDPKANLITVEDFNCLSDKRKQNVWNKLQYEYFATMLNGYFRNKINRK